MLLETPVLVLQMKIIKNEAEKKIKVQIIVGCGGRLMFIFRLRHCRARRIRGHRTLCLYLLIMIY